MMSEYQVIELIFLAIVVGYILYRLYSVLGQNSDKSPMKRNGNVIPLRPKGIQDQDILDVEDEKTVPTENVRALLEKDPNFKVDTFLTGARQAFTMIVESFAAGNLKNIKPFISSKIYKAFQSSIEERDKKGEVVETIVVSIKLAEILASVVTKDVAEITVKFISNQATTVRDSNGNDLHPEHEDLEEVTDIWVFSRSLSSSNPNWQLESIYDVSTYPHTQDI